MLKNPKWTTLITTVYAVLFVILLDNDINPTVTGFMYSISPLIVVWLAYTIIRYGKFEGEELKEDEEWGYSDKNKDSLGMF